MARAKSSPVVDTRVIYCGDNLDYTQFMVLAGVTVSADLPLSNGIIVRPFDALPDGIWKRTILQQFGRTWAAYRPTAFLQASTSFRLEHLSGGIKHRPIESSESQELDDVRLCITALGPFAPLTLGAWSQAEDSVPDLGGGFASIPEAFSMGGYSNEIATDLKGLPVLHSLWTRLGVKRKKHLRVALNRINSARRHVELVNKAIDLSIAIDALFLANRGPDRGELALTLRLRAAHFLGTDAPSRKEIAKTFSLLFSVRSKAIHAGEVPSRVDNVKTDYLLKQGDDYTAEAVRRIIREGEPDWDAIVFE